MRALGAFPIAGTNQDFTIFLTLRAMKLVYRHATSIADLPKSSRFALGKRGRLCNRAGETMVTMTSPNSVPPRPCRLVGWIAFLTLLGFGLRLFHLSNQALWTDEISSIDVARAPLHQVYEQSARINNSLPTYFLLLRECLGQATTGLEFTARFPSTLAGTLSIPVFIGVVWFWRRNWKTALLAGALLAVNPLHVWYSQEVRAYAVMLFFGLLSVLGFEWARAGGKRLGWALYWGAGLLAIALHKTGMIFPVACLIGDGCKALSADVNPSQEGFPARLFRVARKLTVHLPLIIGILAALALKAYPPAEGYRRASSILEVPYTFLTFLGGYSFGPSLSEIQSLGAVHALLQNRLQIGVTALVLALIGWAGARTWRRLIGPELLLLALGIGVVAAYGLISGFPYNVRYTLPALFGFLALLSVLATAAPMDGSASLASGSSSTPRRFARSAIAGVLVIALWADEQWFYKPVYRKADARAAAQWLASHQDQLHSWTVLPGYLSRSVEWYLATQPKVLAANQPSAEDQTTHFPPTPDVLILGRRHHILKPDQLIADYQSAAGAVETNRSIPGFEIFVRAKR